MIKRLGYHVEKWAPAIHAGFAMMRTNKMTSFPRVISAISLARDLLDRNPQEKQIAATLVEHAQMAIIHWS
jgi:hypothetical protein